METNTLSMICCLLADRLRTTLGYRPEVELHEWARKSLLRKPVPALQTVNDTVLPVKGSPIVRIDISAPDPREIRFCVSTPELDGEDVFEELFDIIEVMRIDCRLIRTVA